MDFKQKVYIVISVISILVLGFFRGKYIIKKLLEEQEKNAKGFAKEMAFVFLLINFALILTYIFFFKAEIYSHLYKYYPLLLKGIGYSLIVTIGAIAIGTVLGIITAFIVYKSKKLFIGILFASWLSSLVYIFLGIPAIVAIYFIYYIPGDFLNVFAAATIALGINLFPFITKILTGCIDNIPKEQLDSAIAFGYNPWQINRHFIATYIWQNARHSIFIEWYTTFKLSSLTGLIGLTEAYHASQEIIRETQDPIGSYFILAMCFIVLVSPFAFAVDYFFDNK